MMSKRPTSTAKPTKANFVRSLPPSWSAERVVAAAKAKGITLTRNAVYKMRSNDRTHLPKTGKLPAARVRRADERALVDAIEAVGLDRAKEIFRIYESERATLMSRVIRAIDRG